jgi:hypothetical protein
MIWVLILIILLFLIIINYYFRWKTFQDMDSDLVKMNWQHLSKGEYAKKCFAFIGDHFKHLNGCYLIRPWRNVYLRNIWSIKNFSVPCHIHSDLFQHALLNKFTKKEMKFKFSTKFSDWVVVHFHTLIKLNDKWVDVDPYNKSKGLKFGENINDKSIDNSPLPIVK